MDVLPHQMLIFSDSVVRLYLSDFVPNMFCTEFFYLVVAFMLGSIILMAFVPFLLIESDLQICQNRAPTCCTKKMEESYQAAVRRESMQSIQALNFELKYMIVGHTTAFQGRNC